MPQVAVSLIEGESSLLQAKINTTRVNYAQNTNVLADTRGGEAQSSRTLVNLQGNKVSNQANNLPNNHSEIGRISGSAHR